ncbi:MAG: hypothetical protein IJN46_00625 [Lachnospiraceae bacterium]|jgi:hypothetical protein|nr:hypothetical protein [Lachnospiraceae bacterium]
MKSEYGGSNGRTGRKDQRRSTRREWEQYEDREEQESPAYLELKEQLTTYYRQGVRVSLNGVRMPVNRIAKICAVREEGNYMADYVMDDDGQLTEVRFDRIKRS